MLIADQNELKQVLPIGGTFAFAHFRPFLQRAQRKYLTPVLGSLLLSELDTKKTANTLSPEQEALLELVQPPLAQLAYIDYIPFQQVTIDSSGIRINTTATAKTAFEWQVDDLKAVTEQMGWEGLDGLVDYLDQHRTEHPQWEQSPEYTAVAGWIINTARQFSEYVPVIEGNRKVYLAMRPMMSQAEKQVRHTIGSDQYAQLFTQIRTATITPENETLLTYIRPAVASATFAPAVVQLSLKVGKHGITVFENSPQETSRVRKPAADSKLFELALQHRQQADEAFAELNDFLQSNADTYPLFKNSGLFKDPAAETVPKPDHTDTKGTLFLG